MALSLMDVADMVGGQVSPSRQAAPRPVEDATPPQPTTRRRERVPGAPPRQPTGRVTTGRPASRNTPTRGSGGMGMLLSDIISQFGRPASAQPVPNRPAEVSDPARNVSRGNDLSRMAGDGKEPNRPNGSTADALSGGNSGDNVDPLEGNHVPGMELGPTLGEDGYQGSPGQFPLGSGGYNGSANTGGVATPTSASLGRPPKPSPPRQMTTTATPEAAQRASSGSLMDRLRSAGGQVANTAANFDGQFRAPLAPVSASAASAPSLPPMPEMSLPAGTPGFFDSFKKQEIERSPYPDTPPNPVDNIPNSSGGGIMNQGLSDPEIARRDAALDFASDPRTGMTGNVGAPDVRQYWARTRGIPARYLAQLAEEAEDAHILPPDQRPPLV